jgi:hypothetical protein
MRLKVLVVMALLGLGSQVARANYLFRWYSPTNIFQASFQVEDWQILPGNYFDGPTFYNSIVVTSPDHVWRFGAESQYDVATGSWDPRDRYIVLDLEGGLDQLGLMAGNNIIFEFHLGGPNLWADNRGYWAMSQIPEPPGLALLGLALAAVAAVTLGRRWG